jgi:hypothetical protein
MCVPAFLCALPRTTTSWQGVGKGYSHFRHKGLCAALHNDSAVSLAAGCHVRLTTVKLQMWGCEIVSTHGSCAARPMLYMSQSDGLSVSILPRNTSSSCRGLAYQMAADQSSAPVRSPAHGAQVKHAVAGWTCINPLLISPEHQAPTAQTIEHTGSTHVPHAPGPWGLFTASQLLYHKTAACLHRWLWLATMLALRSVISCSYHVQHAAATATHDQRWWIRKGHSASEKNRLHTRLPSHANTATLTCWWGGAKAARQQPSALIQAPTDLAQS